MRARVLIRPKAGILDPQGQTVERALPALGFEGVAQRARRPAGRARRRGPVAAAGDVRAAAANPLIEDYEIRAREVRRRPLPRLVRRPWTRCSPRERVGDAVPLWHADRDLHGVDAVVIPGGFSYGDYLRVGAIARFAPVMAEVERFARAGGPVLGICNGFQVLCEAGLLPGALLPNTSLRFICARSA